MSTEVPDGATQRHSRMMELLTFINLNEPHGATVTHIQAHMLQVFGLKFRTTSEMVRELAMSGTVKVDGHGFPDKIGAMINEKSREEGGLLKDRAPTIQRR